MKLPIEQFEQSGGEPPHSKDEETLEDDVNYGIADCRKRLRSQRSTLRTQNPQKDGSNRDVSPPTGRVGSYAEIGAMLRRFADMKISTIILDVVADERELDHVCKALASSGVF